MKTFFGAALREPSGARVEQRALVVVAFGGSLVCAAGILGMVVVHLALLSAVDKNFVEAAQTLNVLGSNNFFLPMSGIAIFTLGTGLAVLGAPVTPRWLG